MSARSFLVLDDSVSDRQIISRILGDAFPGAEVKDTDDFAVAVELCGQRAFDCVMLDYNMPRTDGVAVAEQLRAGSPHLPIVLVTGVGDEMLVSHAIRHGVTDYIPKGRINRESIERTVERAIQTCAQTRIIEEQRGELENFAYALAHDFKQPIRQIRTFSQMVAEEIGESPSDEVKQHLAYLDQAARRLGKLVDVMSQYTLLHQPPDLTRVALAPVMAGVVEALEAMIKERDAEVSVECGQVCVHGNEALLGQVLQNLVVNGLKYNKSRVPCVRMLATVNGDQCTIAVQDNGLGIEAQYLSEISFRSCACMRRRSTTARGLGSRSRARRSSPKAARFGASRRWARARPSMCASMSRKPRTPSRNAAERRLAGRARAPISTPSGQVAEWLKAHAWNACIGASLSRVRIPACPPHSMFAGVRMCSHVPVFTLDLE